MDTDPRIQDFFSSWIRIFSRIQIQESQICQELLIFEQNSRVKMLNFF